VDEAIVDEMIEGESALAYSYYCKFRDLGPARTLESARKIFGNGEGRSQRLVEDYSARFSWRERARAWDARIEAAKLAARLKAAAETAAMWERRRQQALLDGWDDAEALRIKALQMLEMPVFVDVESINSDGTTTRAREATGRWNFKNAGDLLHIGSQLKAAVLIAAGREFEDLDEAELRAIADAVVGEAGPASRS